MFELGSGGMEKKITFLKSTLFNARIAFFKNTKFAFRAVSGRTPGSIGRRFRTHLATLRLEI